MTIIKLLESKNRCLERFLELSTKFWPMAEKGEFAGLNDFENKRETIIKAIGLFDRKISQTAATMSYEARTSGLVQLVKDNLARREVIINEIQKLDSKIMERIVGAQSELMKNLNDSRKSKAILGKFRSTWVQESGDKIDKEL